MTSKEQLIEQHIREYQSRLKHVDELFVQAKQVTEDLDDKHESHSELEDYAEQAKYYLGEHGEESEDIKTMKVNKWREETAAAAGPMAIWDILAQKLESFIERHE